MVGLYSKWPSFQIYVPLFQSIVWQTGPKSPESPHYSPIPFNDPFYWEDPESPPPLPLPLPHPLSPPVAVPHPLQFGWRSNKHSWSSVWTLTLPPTWVLQFYVLIGISCPHSSFLCFSLFFSFVPQSAFSHFCGLFVFCVMLTLSHLLWYFHSKFEHDFFVSFVLFISYKYLPVFSIKL